MRKFFWVLLIIGLCSGCDSLRQRNIEIYEKEQERTMQKSLPPEPTLAVKRSDDISDKSILNDDGLNDKEREILNKIKEEDKRKARERSKKIFGIFAPKD